MKKRVLFFVFILILVLVLCACSESGSSSSFSVIFIDVGQGDSTLIECDGHHMLIDGGDVAAGDKVYNVLEERGIQRLDILALSHLHADHIGGLEKALTYASKIDLTISNSDQGENETFRKVEHLLGINGASITIPHVGDKFSLGSAEVEVVDIASENPNDSLVLLVKYGNTKLLFTGDIEYEGQKRIADMYQNEDVKKTKIDLMKMPHHGSSDGDLIRFVRTFMPDYAIISCGTGNMYGHPHRETLDLLNQAGVKVYQTDLDGDIIVRSDGKTLSVDTSK